MPTPVVPPQNPELPSLPLGQCPPAGGCPGTQTADCPPSTTTMPSCGYVLPSQWTDGIYDHNQQGIRLLGRIGKQLALLMGSGLLKIQDGKAFVVKSLPLTLATLWHQWWRTEGPLKRPVLGEPLPAPYQVIADSNGELHAIQGLQDEETVSVWDPTAKAFVMRSVADFPLLRRGHLPRANALELVGVTAIPAGGDPLEVRPFSTLSGEGVLIVKQSPTTPSSCACEGCEPVAAVSSIVQFVPFPSGDGDFTLKWNATDGVHFAED